MITIKEIKRVFQEYKFLRILLIIITAFVFVSLLYHFVFGRVPKYKTVDGLEYDGNIHYKSSFSKSNIKYNLPSNYVEHGFKGIRIYKDGEGVNPNKRCILTIDNVSYKNIDHLLEGMTKFYKVDSSEVEINGKRWYYIEEDRTYHNEYYLIEYKRNILMVNMEYSFESCKNDLQGIIDSIQLK